MKRILAGIIIVLLLAACTGGAKKGVQFPEGNNVVTIVPLSFDVKSYLIKTEKGYILVDTGMFDKDMDNLIAAAGISPESINLIIVTHVHGDHVGSIAYAKELTGAQVICQENAVPFLEEGKSEPVIARNFTGKLVNAISPKKPFNKIKPEIVFKDDLNLAEYGIAGKIIHTPGHTASSIAVVLDNGEMIVGDTVRGKPDNLSLGMFYDDKTALIKSIEKILAYTPRIIYLSHGTVTDYETLTDFVNNLDKYRVNKIEVK